VPVDVIVDEEGESSVDGMDMDERIINRALDKAIR
jgi:hypothetical protein